MPNAESLSRASENGISRRKSRFSAFRSSGSNFAADFDAAEMSNILARSDIDCAATTFSDVPVSTASDATVIGSSPDSRRLAIDSAPVRFDSASPVAAVSRL